MSDWPDGLLTRPLFGLWQSAFTDKFIRLFAGKDVRMRLELTAVCLIFVAIAQCKIEEPQNPPPRTDRQFEDERLTVDKEPADYQRGPEEDQSKYRGISHTITNFQIMGICGTGTSRTSRHRQAKRKRKDCSRRRIPAIATSVKNGMRKLLYASFMPIFFFQQPRGLHQQRADAGEAGE